MQQEQRNTVEQIVAQAVAQQAAPFLVAMVGNAASVRYCCAAGDAAPDRPVDENSVFRLFSMSKAVGALAAMILIDRQQLDFDTPVAEIIPAWDDLQVLEGFDGTTPIWRSPARVATIKHLATHTSGLCYDSWHDGMKAYRRHSDVPSFLTGKAHAFDNPLMHDPGTRWGYGMGIDWLGRVVEVVDGRRIDAFCQQEIFAPLGMLNTAFEPDDLEARMCKMYSRADNGAFVPVVVAPPAQPDFYGMGHALYSTPSDYMRFLRMILRQGELDGQRLLSAHSVEMMMVDQLANLPLKAIAAGDMGAQYPPLPTVVEHSFMANRQPQNPAQTHRRGAGSQSWAGICNTHFWLDPARDVAAVWMTQTLPFMDQALMDAFALFEQAVYGAEEN